VLRRRKAKTKRRHRRFETPNVQGDDSYVVVTLPTVGEVRPIVEMEATGRDTFEAKRAIVTGHIVEWNWVGDDGRSLPLPVNVDQLTTDEYELLIELLIGSFGHKEISDQLLEALHTGGKPAPMEYIWLQLCRDVYHCSQTELEKQPWTTAMLDIRMIGVENKVRRFKRKIRR
jgi:hypothetical protein